MKVVFDFDGTLCDITHRRHFVDEKRWDRFFKACIYDEPIWPVINALKSHLAAGDDVQIWSGRSDEVRAESEDWLEEQAKVPCHLLTRMRVQGDYTPDDLLKQQWLHDSIVDGWKPDMIYDDRQRVVDMWRRNGIVCAQVAPGDFDKPKVIKPNPDRDLANGPLLILLVGPSGAGKDTFLHDCVRITAMEDGYWMANNIPSRIVSSDYHRHLLTGDFKDQSRNNEMWAGLHSVVQARLNAGLPTTVNSTNIRDADRKALLDLLPEGEFAHYIVLDRPLKEKLETRGWRPEWLINKHHNTMQSNLKKILAGDNDPRVSAVHDERLVPENAS